MSKTLSLLFFLFNILTYSVYGSTSTAETGDFRTSKQQKEPKSEMFNVPENSVTMYSMIKKSSKPGIQRTFPGLHVVQQTRISRLAKATYRGPNNIITRPHNSRSSASSYSIKPSSLFMAALGHLIFGLLLVTCFF